MKLTVIFPVAFVITLSMLSSFIVEKLYFYREGSEFKNKDPRIQRIIRSQNTLVFIVLYTSFIGTLFWAFK